MEDYSLETKFGKRIIYWAIGLVLVLSIGGFLCTRTVQVVDNGIVHYEEFQDIYNTCTKLNTDLCNMKDLPENDVMFEQFSKPQRILAIKTNLNRWVEQYNSNSKKFNQSIWKSNQLPYQLSVNNFNCY